MILRLNHYIDTACTIKVNNLLLPLGFERCTPEASRTNHVAGTLVKGALP